MALGDKDEPCAGKKMAELANYHDAEKDAIDKIEGDKGKGEILRYETGMLLTIRAILMNQKSAHSSRLKCRLLMARQIKMASLQATK